MGHPVYCSQLLADRNLILFFKIQLNLYFVFVSGLFILYRRMKSTRLTLYNVHSVVPTRLQTDQRRHLTSSFRGLWVLRVCREGARRWGETRASDRALNVTALWFHLNYHNYLHHLTPLSLFRDLCVFSNFLLNGGSDSCYNFGLEYCNSWPSIGF